MRGRSGAGGSARQRQRGRRGSREGPAAGGGGQVGGGVAAGLSSSVLWSPRPCPLELLLGLTQRASELGELGAAEQQQDHQEDDEQFGRTEVHGGGAYRGRWYARASARARVRRERLRGRTAPSSTRSRLPPAHDLLDLHADPDHHRCVLTLVGDAAPRRVAAEAVARIDLRGPPGRAPPHRRRRRRPVRAARRLDDGRRPSTRETTSATWAAADAGAPVLPLRTRAHRCPRCGAAPSRDLAPDAGPPTPTRRRARARSAPARCSSPTTSGSPTPDLDAGPRRWLPRCGATAIRALGLAVGDRVQVSMNLHRAARRRARPRRGTASRRSRRSPAPSSSGWCPRAVLERDARRPLGAARPRRRRGRSRPGWPRARPRRCQVPVWRRARARWRRMRRRSRSLIPPQMPNFSPLARAYSRHSSRTTQPRQTSLASRVDAPRSGKNRSGSTPRQLASPASHR